MSGPKCISRPKKVQRNNLQSYPGQDPETEEAGLLVVMGLHKAQQQGPLPSAPPSTYGPAEGEFFGREGELAQVRGVLLSPHLTMCQGSR